jgi:hypothetical protein
VAGVYTITLARLPPNYVPSTICPRQDPPQFDPPLAPNPTVLGNGEFANTGFLAGTVQFGPPNACTAFYLTMDLAPGDPIVINNNLPFRFFSAPAPTLSSWAWMVLGVVLVAAAFFALRKRQVLGVSILGLLWWTTR